MLPTHALKSNRLRNALGLSLPLAITLLSACGGGGGGTGVAGNGQSSDPTAVEFPLAYVRRPQLAETDPVPDLRDPFAFSPGAKLYVRSRADTNATETCVTCSLYPGQEELYDVKDLDVSPDGNKLVFALHPPLIENADPEDQTTWQIWEYDFATRVARRIISSDNLAQLGNAVSPRVLPDDSIVFVSDAQVGTRANALNLAAPAYSGIVEAGTRRKAGVLHTMSEDGTGITQISQNQSHDLSPWVLRSGKILFSRWDALGGTDRSLNLYTLNPDGSGLSSLYGFYSHNGSSTADELQFALPREMEDGRVLAILRRFQSNSLGGDLIAIDVARYSDATQPTWENLGLTGSAQASLAVNTITTDGTLSPGGQYGAAFPMWDGSNRFIVSWAQCFALNAQQQRVPCAVAPAGADPAPPEYGIWIFTPGANATQRPVVLAESGVIFTDVVAGAPRTGFTQAPSNGAANDPVFSAYNSALLTDSQGVLAIRSVANLDNQDTSATIAAQVDPANPGYKARTSRFLRLIEAIPLPDRQDPDPVPELDNFVFGRSNFMRRIIGYVPVEPDGSVAVKVPANVPFTFQLVDGNGMRRGSTHEVWWQVGEGEVLRCGGCHVAGNTSTHGRIDSTPRNSNPGATLAAAGGGFVASNLHDQTIKAGTSGQTLAEAWTQSRVLRSPSVNLQFADEWATNGAQQNPAFDYSYRIPQASNGLAQVPVAPTASNCVTTWRNDCRIVINYLDHIQSIWEKPRTLNSADATCTSCHSAAATGGVFNAGQLDLTDEASDRDADRVMSWSELFTGDTQKDVNGADILVNGAPILDANGDPVLDGMGNPTFTQVTVPVAPVLANGALASPRFFGCFTTGGTCGTVNGGAANNRHVGMLTASELRLVAEWLDIGAQYYNDIAKANTASQ